MIVNLSILSCKIVNLAGGRIAFKATTSGGVNIFYIDLPDIVVA